MAHHCHAFACNRVVAPKFLMCRHHWSMVKPDIQKRVWATYRRGQEIDKEPSEDYLLAQRAAVWQVFVDEGGCTWADVPEVGSRSYMIGPGVLTKR